MQVYDAGAQKQDLVWELEDRPELLARLDGRPCRADADCEHPALTCVRYSEEISTGTLSLCHVDCTSLKCPRGNRPAIGVLTADG